MAQLKFGKPTPRAMAVVQEDGMLCAERLSALGSGSSGHTLAVSPGNESGFVASVEQNPDLWSVVRNFVNRMKEAYPRYRKL